MRSAAGRSGALAITLVVLGSAFEPAGAQPAAMAAVQPPGTTTLVEGAAWSWFEDARVMFTGDGTELTASAVTGTGSPTAAPGTVVLAQIDMATGARQLVDLGQSEADDHNSASIHEDVSGELTTAWTRHHRDRLIRTQRRRSDGSWLRLQPFDAGSTTTYNNLRSGADAEGNVILYDFIRGQSFDPDVIASGDLGRTWRRLGRVLRDPLDLPTARPYVQYSASRGGRIDLIATETHPSSTQTSVYHGYIQSGVVHDSSGTVLGPLGSAIPVTALSRVWAPTADERGWTADIVVDPATGAPTVAFSVWHTADDHRYWYGQWTGSTWAVEEIAFAGRALYPAEGHYTGLIALDPQDGRHVVVSADVSPTTGAPLVSTADGQRHWELFDGRRAANGTWSWTPLTANSTSDNLRPELTASENGASALLWLRGRYTSYLNYDLDVVGVVRRADRTVVPAGPATWAPIVDVLAVPAPRPQLARVVVGQLDGHPADDLLLARGGAAPDDLFLGDEQRHPTPIAARPVQSSSTPIAGDYDGNGRTDIYWYSPGQAGDSLWSTSGVASFAAGNPRQVIGTYTPIPGDYNGDGADDIYWYAPGTTTDNLWTANPDGTFTTTIPRQVIGTYTPIPGDYNGDGADDIHWYAPGTTTDNLWTANPDGTFTTTIPRQVIGTYTPIPGDYNGDGADDIYWYAPGTTTDNLWTANPDGTFTTTIPRQVIGTYTPIPGDHDGDGADDIHWYGPGRPDFLWWSTNGPLADTEPAAVNL